MNLNFVITDLITSKSFVIFFVELIVRIARPDNDEVIYCILVKTFGGFSINYRKFFHLLFKPKEKYTLMLLIRILFVSFFANLNLILLVLFSILKVHYTATVFKQINRLVRLRVQCFYVYSCQGSAAARQQPVSLREINLYNFKNYLKV